MGVGPTVTIGVCGGVEGGVEFAGVEFFLPEVADAIVVGVVDGVEAGGGEEGEKEEEDEERARRCGW